MEQAVQVINFEEMAMSLDKVVKQVNLIQEIMAKVMKVNEHYGTIPGCKKPSLYKPGAEKLSLTFRLSPEYKITKTDLKDGHREYEVVCTLTHMPTGQFIGQGVGSCSTLEGKYKYPPIIKRTHPIPDQFFNKYLKKDKEICKTPIKRENSIKILFLNTSNASNLV